MGGVSGIPRAEQTVFARLMLASLRYDTHLPTLWLCGGRAQKRDKALPAFLSGRELSPSTRLDARHFSFSLYTTGVFHAATPVLELRGNGPE